MWLGSDFYMARRSDNSLLVFQHMPIWLTIILLWLSTSSAQTCSDGIKNGKESDVDCGGTCNPCGTWKLCNVAADCLSNNCPAGNPSRCNQALTCTNGIKDGRETDIDCGGGGCDAACNVAQSCASKWDCKSSICTSGKCTDATTCKNAIRDGRETDVDCGGGGCAAKCTVGKVCATGLDCDTGICTGGKCAPKPTCTDKIKNGQETDVDCGGPTCPACTVDKMCSIDRDCDSADCIIPTGSTFGKCAPKPTCTDNIKNGQETDIDCGGPTCPACVYGDTCTANSDCNTSNCSGGKCGEPTTCKNSIKDGQEGDVDCGGLCFYKCGTYKTCQVSSDCLSNNCIGGKCLEAATCYNGIKDGKETGVDCGGGGCNAACDVGEGCGSVWDCVSKVCTSGKCADAPTCKNGIKDATETDVDCGGSSCAARCIVGKTCASASDCGTGICTNGECAPQPTCTDNIKNGQETDVDCGGPTCPACVFGDACAANSDCNTNNCSGGKCGEPTTCKNGVKDGQETDVDCGGLCIAKCRTSKVCSSSADCISNNCGPGVCIEAATCYNGIKDGKESGVDCGGGGCNAACDVGEGCGSVWDCVSKVCTSGKCADAPTCKNGIKDATETDVDCGGSSCAARCIVGKTCASASDCGTGICTNGKCAPQPTCTDNIKNGQETDVDCGGPTCPACVFGNTCTANGDCNSNNCSGGKCSEPITCKNGVKDGQEGDVDCGGLCIAQCGTYRTCQANSDCLSNSCSTASRTCVEAATCYNGIKDGRESDVDCGGGGCNAVCAVGQTCLSVFDCGSKACTNGKCVDAGTCKNGVKDGAETDVDCGGTGCSTRCARLAGCAAGSDCSTGYCSGGKCSYSPACNNGAKDGLETDIDCGGPSCGPCTFGQGCSAASDCGSRLCSSGNCVEAATCKNGVKDGQEGDVDCGGAQCFYKCGTYKTCATSADCLSDNCGGGRCLEATTCHNGIKDGRETAVDCGGGGCNAACDVGERCGSVWDCYSKICNAGYCASATTCSNKVRDGRETDVDCGGGGCAARCAVGFQCQTGGDCVTGICTAGYCQPPPPTCTDGITNGQETDVDCGGPVCKPCQAQQLCRNDSDCDNSQCLIR
eukprot:jgi/Chrzof1/6594/Cz19g02010.t1